MLLGHRFSILGQKLGFVMKPIELPTLSPPAGPALAPEDISRMQDEVRALAEERNAVILANNY
jgi:hypothetical protein